MTRTQRRQISSDFQRLQGQIERRYVTKILNALKRQISKVAEDVKFFGIEFAIRRVRVMELDAVMIDTIKDMHVFTGLTVANRTLRGLRRFSPRKMANLGFNDRWVRQILEYFNLHLLESAKSIDETTRKHILKILQRGYEEAWSNDEMAKAINDKLYMKNRAVKIVRTESTRAAGYGILTGANEYEYEVQKEWVSIPDNRRRHSHANVEGELRDMDQPFSNNLMFPGDPEGPPEETIFCFLPDQLTGVNMSVVKKAFRSWYQGKTVTIKTSGDNRFTCTPNHPILTMRGWVKAGELTSGDNLVKSSLLNKEAFVELNVNDKPTTFEQLFDTSGSYSMRVSRSSVNFYGDRPASDVDVVCAEGELRNWVKPCINQCLSEINLTGANFRTSSLFSNSRFSVQLLVKLFGFIAKGLVSVGNQLLSLFGISLGHSQEHGFAPISLSYASGVEPGSNASSGNTKLAGNSLDAEAAFKKLNNGIGGDGGFLNPANFDSGSPKDFTDHFPVTADNVCDFIEAFPGIVEVDNVLSVDVGHYVGYVYTLETNNQMYDINSYVARNCRCTMAIVPKRDLEGQLIPKRPQIIRRPGAAALPIPV